MVDKNIKKSDSEDMMNRINNGKLTINEIRKVCGLEPLKDKICNSLLRGKRNE